MRTVTHHYEIFVRTFTNVPNLLIIIPSSYHAKIFVRTFTNIPKLPIIIPSSYNIMHHPIPYHHPRSPSLK